MTAQYHPRGRAGLWLCLAAAGLTAPHTAFGYDGSPATPALQKNRADFAREKASVEAHEVADWIVDSGDNRGLPFVIVDKRDAKVFVFGHAGDLRGAAAALLGLGRGDGSTPGIGKRRLATINIAERTTPAGRFQASLGHDYQQDILWIDYESSLSMHRVIVGKPSEQRHKRLESATVTDNRISFGCINVPVKFYDGIIVPAFTGTVGIVYILPENKALRDVFAFNERASEPESAADDFISIPDIRAALPQP